MFERVEIPLVELCEASKGLPCDRHNVIRLFGSNCRVDAYNRAIESVVRLYDTTRILGKCTATDLAVLIDHLENLRDVWRYDGVREDGSKV